MLSGVYDAFQKWGAQGAVWIYSDPHFSDKDLECGIKNRISDEEQIANINAKCGRKDTLIILGEVGNIECVRKLRAARKILIMGNHDKGATNYKKDYVVKKYDKDKFSLEEALSDMAKDYPNWKLTSTEGYQYTSPFQYWAITAHNCLFDEVYEGALIIGEKLILSHEPVDIPWAFNIHGHDHAGHQTYNHLNVCSDIIGYEPINFNQFLKSGAMSKIQTIHRETIDKATKRKKKRGGKKIGAK